jgi:hypothetical protein
MKNLIRFFVRKLYKSIYQTIRINFAEVHHIRTQDYENTSSEE